MTEADGAGGSPVDGPDPWGSARPGGPAAGGPPGFGVFPGGYPAGLYPGTVPYGVPDPPPYGVPYAGPCGAPHPMPYGPPYTTPYGAPVRRPRRPGVATAAATLGFVLAGLDLLGGLVTLGLMDAVSFHTSNAVQTAMLVCGLAALAVGGVMIAGAVRMLHGRTTMLVTTGVATGLIAVLWMLIASDIAGDRDTVGPAYVWPAMYLTLAVVIVCFALGRAVGTWVAATGSGAPG